MFHKLLNVLSIILIEHELVKTLGYSKLLNNYEKNLKNNYWYLCTFKKKKFNNVKNVKKKIYN